MWNLTESVKIIVWFTQTYNRKILQGVTPTYYAKKSEFSQIWYKQMNG